MYQKTLRPHYYRRHILFLIFMENQQPLYFIRP
uniref:Uncharacterized protein n=1 Tax=Siphoviridae sp. ctB3v5 TaxID=2826186 RepID=A0A8S5M8H1_9CAUD|nr:MAG TPA: hypothetical protein [Siphoviridae sp. ctB3v5]